MRALAAGEIAAFLRQAMYTSHVSGGANGRNTTLSANS